MFKLGYTQKAYVTQVNDREVYVSDQIEGEDEALLVENFKKNYKVNDEIEVFVYNRDEEACVATVKKPILEVGNIGFLKVVGKVKGGFFLYNGIEKDVFMSNDDVKRDVKIGDTVLVQLYLEERDLLNASMKIYDYLTISTRYTIGEMVSGTVYDIKSEMGAFVAVEDRFHGFIPKHELYKEIKEGAKISARITKIRDDGKLNLSVRQKIAVQIHDDESIVMKALEDAGGFLTLGDHSDPEQIKQKLNLSKRAFKRVIGKLYKEEKIEITSVGIKKI